MQFKHSLQYVIINIQSKTAVIYVECFEILSRSHTNTVLHINPVKTWLILL